MLKYEYVLPIGYKGLSFYGSTEEELAEEFEEKLREYGEPIFTEEGTAAGTVRFIVEAPSLWELSTLLHDLRDELEAMYRLGDFDCLIQNPDELES